ncbi:hypothetical protein FRC04_002175 [Tulasnella sp. 424]|nr:hypothetical protein FRC04_002175 [Tulasnella sp. 424]KAG8967818.1 hypothetical protein FRC05_001914 [Tulasnella sp. 425]
MSGGHQQLETLYEENRKQVIGSQMRAVREEFEQGMALLMRSKGESKDTKESVKDVGGLFSKLDHKNSVFTSNSGAVAQHSKSIESSSIQLEGRFSTFAKDHEQRTLQLKEKAAQLRWTEAEATKAFKSAIATVEDVTKEAQDFVHAERQAMAGIITISEEASAAEKTLLTTLLDSEKVKAEKMRDDLIKQVVLSLSMREAIDSVRADIREGQQEMSEVEERARNVGRGAKAWLTRSIHEQRGDLEKQTGELTTTHTAALEHLDRSKRARIELTSTILETDTGALGGFEELQRGLWSFRDLGKGRASLAVSKIRGTTSKLSVEGTREDAPAGATPRKRRQMKQGRQPVRSLNTAAPVDSEDRQDMEDVEVEHGLAAEVLSPGTSSATLPKLRSVSGTISGKPPSNEARKAAPLS